jgi:hypothetical protein
VGFTSFDDFLEKTTDDGNVLEAPFYKSSSLSEAAGVWHSLWTASGYPTGGAAPAGTPGAAYVNAAGGLGAWGNQDPLTKHLLSIEAGANRDCWLMLYDRLVGVGGISLTSTGNKTVSSAALPRYTDGVGVQAWLEVSTITATPTCVVNLSSYTDHEGNTGASGGTLTFPATVTNVDTFLGPLPLAAGDLGVRAVSTLNVATASGGAGATSLVLIKPLAYLPLTASLGAALDLMAKLPSLPRVFDGATLGLAFVATGTNLSTDFWGLIRAGYG